MILISNKKHEQMLKSAVNSALSDIYAAAKKGDGSLSETIERSSFIYQNQDLTKWKNALALALSNTDPNRTQLYTVYDSIMRDPHVAGLVESRILKVIQSEWAIYNVDGSINEEATDILQTGWFTDLVRMALKSIFWGPVIIELSQLNIDPILSRVRQIPVKNTNVDKRLILQRNGDSTGYSVDDPALATYYVQVGDADALGLLENLAPSVFLKKYALGSWSNYVEKFGVPPVTGTVLPGTSGPKKSKLLDVLKSLINSSVAVLEEGETITIHEPKGTDAYKTFDELIKRCNSEISKMILGQDATSTQEDATGTYGSLKVMQDVATDRHESDKLFVKNFMNTILLPRLQNMGFAIPAGAYFDWDEMIELEPAALVDVVVKLEQYYSVDFDYIVERTGIPILGPKTTITQPITPPANA